MEMGADSLAMLKASRMIQDKLGVRLPFRVLIEEYPSIATLSVYLAQEVTPDRLPADPIQSAACPAAAASRSITDSCHIGKCETV
jgi:hypothetical protein